MKSIHRHQELKLAQRADRIERNMKRLLKKTYREQEPFTSEYLTEKAEEQIIMFVGFYNRDYSNSG